MGWVKGQSGNPAGRPPGQNSITLDMREAMRKLSEGNVTRVQAWLDQIAEKDPAEALGLFLRLIEYHLPKLGRTEVTGRDGEPLEPPVITINFPDAENKR